MVHGMEHTAHVHMSAALGDAVAKAAAVDNTAHSAAAAPGPARHAGAGVRVGVVPAPADASFK